VDHALRGILRVARPLARKGVLGQSFATNAYRLAAVKALVTEYDLQPRRVIYLNQTFSPFNTLFPFASVSLAKWLSRNCFGYLLQFCSADFLLFLMKGDRVLDPDTRALTLTIFLKAVGRPKHHEAVGRESNSENPGDSTAHVSHLLWH
jgi:hypothetical protein